MALDIDAFAVLRVIADNPAVFIDIRADAAKLAGGLAEKLRMLLVKQIKTRTGTLSSIRKIHAALGADSFDRVVDTLKDAELKTLVGRFDKHHPEQKTASAAWRRGHFRALIEGSTEPAAKAAPARKKKAPSIPKASRKKKRLTEQDDDFLFDESAGAVRDKD